MPWISDRDWQAMQQALVEGVHTRGERRDRKVVARLTAIEEEIKMTRAEFKAQQKAILQEVKDTRGQVQSGFDLLTKTIAQIKAAAENADNMDDFKEDLALIESETMATQDAAKAAIAANPAPTDPATPAAPAGG